jgi:hypothetical protein
MRRTLFDWFLLLVVLVGGILAWQTSRERSRLTARHSRLARVTGDLLIVDATKVHALALNTGYPLHFAWRVYLPPNYSQKLRGGGMMFTPGSGQPAEFIARVRLRPRHDGDMDVYTHVGKASIRISLGNNALAELLYNRWDKIKVEQLGAPELAVIKADQPAVLLKLTLPDDLQSEAQKKLSPNQQQQFDPVLFELNLGP